jgi:hypothetical protein
MLTSGNSYLGWLLVLGAVGSAFGQTIPSDIPPVNVTEVERSQLTQRFVNDKLVIWRQRLKLEDWQISAVMARRSDLAPKTLGAIKWDKPKKTAVIWVLDPADYLLPYPAMLDDMELTIVHELVHLELASLPRGQASRGSEERAVNGLVQALLGLDRQKP